MDFVERLNDAINAIPELGEHSRQGFVGPDVSLAISPIPGSRVVQKYMDGMADEQLNYTVVLKSKDLERLQKTLWAIANHVEEITGIKSRDNSFDFDEIVITNKPNLSSQDESGFYYGQLDIQATVTTYK
ncbi:minor capsid protein [Lacticaseibacillus saniviri]|uniref:minor capsid protein n=1 Tax=Lacticaseibacillus saniviri TaxID=931533 RepID=UPI001EE070E6|nr:minor capsid protein [Lacticaseibacillus saniviri]MCG4280856.1 minor capsid protein [Lacticaseibacillus saniviri]